MMAASCEGGQDPKRAVAPYMDGLICAVDETICELCYVLSSPDCAVHEARCPRLIGSALKVTWLSSVAAVNAVSFLTIGINKVTWPAEMEKKTQFIICAIGIFVCYFYFGVLQEKITRGSYGEDENKEKFTCMLALVFFQCVVNYIFAKILLATVMKQGEDNTRSLYYSSSALTYLLAMVCSNMALQWVNYPTQVVGKSGKPIPVMILGVLLGKKNYPLRKYVFVLMIVVGVAVFMYKDGKSGEGSSVLGFGEFLLVLSLVMDGLTAAIQERMRSEHKTKSGHMMLSMNLWSTIYLGVALIVTGEGLVFVNFVQRHPSLVWQLITISLASALGQFFIFLTVSDFGPLPCSIITTTRKFFTVLGSVILFGNNLLYRQWFATVIVFTGLFLDSMYGKAVVKIK